jgi:hypothetical protein
MKFVSLLLPLIVTVGIFFLGRFLVLRPGVPTRLFTLGKFAESRVGFWFFRSVGYLLCVGCIFFWILTPLYLILYLRQHP